MLKIVYHKTSKKVICALLLLVCVMCATILYADEGKTKAQLIQEALLNNESASTNAEQVVTEKEQPQKKAEEIINNKQNADLFPVNEIEARIQKLDMTNPNAAEVKKLRQSYDALKMADKLTISNIDDLSAAEARLEEIRLEALSQEDEYEYEYDEEDDMESIEEIDASQDSPDTVRGTTYVFSVSESQPSVSIIARFSSDDNHDDIGDKADFVLIGPGDLEYEIPMDKRRIEDDDTYINITWTPKYVQFDIATLKYATWKFEATTSVSYEKKAYVGPAITMKPVEPSSEGEVSYTPSFMDIYGDVLKLGFVLILIVVMLIGFMIFSRKKWGINGEKAQNQSGKTKKKPSISELRQKQQEEYKEKEGDELLKQIKKEYEQQKKAAEQMDEEAKREQLEASRRANDDPDIRNEVTTRDYESAIENGELEEYEESVGDTDLLKEKEPKPEKAYGGRFGSKHG